MLKLILFGTVIFLANIMQGITGFAGTILAMPASLILVGYDTAKPVLNVLGLMSGIYVFAGNRKHVSGIELKKVVLNMSLGIAAGIFLKRYLSGNDRILYIILGIFITVLSVHGLYSRLGKGGAEAEEGTSVNKSGASALLLPMAGIVHGIFVSGGPLLIGYLSGRLKDKNTFRATISTVWIILNSIILFDDIRSGMWSAGLIRELLITVPFLFAGMKLGSMLYSRMSQELFMIITYILLFVSGITLLFK